MGSLSFRQGRNEWKHGISVGLGSAAKSTSTTAKAGGPTRSAVPRTAATVHEEDGPTEASLTGVGSTPPCSRHSDSWFCGGFVVRAQTDVAT